MSNSSKKLNTKYSFIKIVLLIITAKIITGCMFTPIYASLENLGSSKIQKELASIEIKHKYGFLEQHFQIVLEDLLIPSKNIKSSKKNTLEFSIKTESVPISILKDNTVTHYNLYTRVYYKFMDGDKLIKSGILRNNHEYKNTDSEFATYTAKESITKKLLTESASQLRYIIISSLLNYKKEWK